MQAALLRVGRESERLGVVVGRERERERQGERRQAEREQRPLE
jgi:hypothetical protein